MYRNFSENSLYIRSIDSENFLMIVAFVRKLWSPKDDQNSAASLAIYSAPSSVEFYKTVYNI